MMNYCLTAVFKSPKEAKRTKKALKDFINRELELWNLLQCQEEFPSFQDLEKAQDYVDSREAQLESLRMVDRMTNEVQRIGDRYRAHLKYRIYIAVEPEIQIEGRTLRISTIGTTELGFEKIKQILNENGGITHP